MSPLEWAFLATSWAFTEGPAKAVLGETLTGEHGVGLLKRDWLQDEVGDISLDLEQSIKALFDPLGILYPGKAILNYLNCSCPVRHVYQARTRSSHSNRRWSGSSTASF
jgi:hypothetical protein